MNDALRAVALATALSACSVSTTDGRYLGTTTPDRATNLCIPSRSTLQIAPDGVVTYAPDEATWILKGTITNETITADRVTQGPNRQPYETTLTATRSNDTITGTYKTPRCTYTVTLKR